MLKTKKFRRLLAALLSVLMLSISLPLAAFAADGEQTDAEKAGTTPKTSVAFLFTDNATFSQTVVSDRVYELNGTYTAADISVPVPEYFELDVADDWTFTVSDPEPTITVPVKRAAQKTGVAFLFTDNATFSQTVVSDRVYELNGTYTAADISVALPEGWELDVADDWSFTVETAEPTIMVPVKRSAPKTEVAFLFTDNATFSQTVISERIYEIGGEFTAEDISVDVPDGWELDLPEGWSFKVETSEPTVTVPVKAAAKTPEEPTNPGEPEQPAKPADENTTTVTSDSGKDTAKAEQVVKSDTAPAASATKVLPQTGVETAAPVLGFVVVLVAALGGAGCYLFVVRKKLN